MAVLAGCILVEIGLHTSRWYPRVRERTAYPSVEVARIADERGGRIVRVGPRPSLPPFVANVPMAYGAGDVDGQAVMFPADYDRYRRLIDDYGDLALVFNSAPPLADGADLTSPLLDALDARTIVAEPGVPVPAGYVPLTTGTPVAYARPSPGPAVLVPRADPATEDEMWRRVADPTWDPLATAAVVGLAGPVEGGTGTATARSRTSDRETWEVDAPSGGFLRVSGRFDEGWSAEVDGRSAQVLEADGIFRGVVVPPGRHRVDLSYANPAERDGRIAGLAAAAVLLALARRGHRSRLAPAGRVRRRDRRVDREARRVDDGSSPEVTPRP